MKLSRVNEYIFLILFPKRENETSNFYLAVLNFFAPFDPKFKQMVEKEIVMYVGVSSKHIPRFGSRRSHQLPARKES